MMNDETKINNLIYKTISRDRDDLTSADINDIHEQLKTLRQLKESQKNRKELIKDIFTILFHTIYMGMILFNILMTPLLIAKGNEYKSLGVGDLIILLIEITMTAIFIEYIYFGTTSKIMTLEEDVDNIKTLKDK